MIVSGMLGMRLHCYSPLEGGLLGNTDTPRGKPLQQRLDGQPGLAGALRDIDKACDACGISKQLATMRWFFHHSALRPGDAIIVGASSIEQLESNLDQLDEHSQKPLDRELAAAIDRAWETWCARGPERQPMGLGHMEVAKL